MNVIFRNKESGHWEILVNGDKWREVHRTIFGRKPHLPPISSLEEFPAIFDEYEYRRVRGYVLWRFLKQSYHSEQLTKILRERLVQTHTIDRVLTDCFNMGLLNDESWLQNFMSRQRKRCSLRAALSKLYAKGLSAATIKSIGGQNTEEDVGAIQHLLHTRYRSKNLSHYQDKRKVIAALLRKGYTFDQIQRAIDGCS